MKFNEQIGFLCTLWSRHIHNSLRIEDNRRHIEHSVHKKLNFLGFFVVVEFDRMTKKGGRPGRGHTHKN